MKSTHRNFAQAVSGGIFNDIRKQIAVRIVCGALTCNIAIILGVFAYAGYSTEYSATVILYEAFFLAIQFAVSHITHAAKTPT